MEGVENQLHDLSLSRDEEEVFDCEFESDTRIENCVNLALVGRFLTDRQINYGAMKKRMANLWRPDVKMVRDWGAWLRAPLRRDNTGEESRWIRNDLNVDEMMSNSSKKVIEQDSWDMAVSIFSAKSTTAM
ncbi:hypothetical protein DH2020_023215 [Rehmannia glutinosa]|uniref:Uncharacterized protein n=1 Tax=Rehmannia glutinosa TaxID=99300 RepID=A0ABR0W689_REHGL